MYDHNRNLLILLTEVKKNFVLYFNTISTNKKSKKIAVIYYDGVLLGWLEDYLSSQSRSTISLDKNNCLKKLIFFNKKNTKKF